MTKSQLVVALAEKHGLSKARARVAVDAIFDSMTAALENGESIEVRGFGRLHGAPF